MQGGRAIRLSRLKPHLNISTLPRPVFALLGAVIALSILAAYEIISTKLSEHQTWDLVSNHSSFDSVRFSPDFRIIAANDILGVNLWDSSSKRLLGTAGTFAVLSQLQFTPDGSTLAWTNNEYALLYDVYTGGMVATPARAKGQIKAIAFAPRQSSPLCSYIFATGGLPGSDGKSAVELWDTNEPDEYHYTVAEFPGQEGTSQDHSVRSLSFSEDDQYLAAGMSDSNFYVWKVSSDPFQCTSQASPVLTSSVAHNPNISTIAINAADKLVAVGDGSNGVVLYNMADGKVVRQLTSTQVQTQLVFSPDGKMLAVGEALALDNELRQGIGKVSVWRVSDGTNVWSSSSYSTPVANLGFSADGKKLTAGYYDGTVQTYTLP